MPVRVLIEERPDLVFLVAIEERPNLVFWLLSLQPGALGVWEVVSVIRGWHEVYVGLNLLEFRETTGAAQAAMPLCL